MPKCSLVPSNISGSHSSNPPFRKVPSTTRACLSQTGAGWCLGPLEAPLRAFLSASGQAFPSQGKERPNGARLSTQGNLQTSSTTRPCLSQTGAGWCLTSEEGRGSEQSIHQLRLTIASDPLWYPGKAKPGAQKRGRKPKLTEAKRLRAAKSATSLQASGIEPSAAAVVDRAPNATLNPDTGEPFTPKYIYFLAGGEWALVSWGGEVGDACGEGGAEVSQRSPDVTGPIHSWGGEVRTPCGEGAAEAPRCGGAHTLMGRRGLHPLMHRPYNTSRHH